MTDKEIALELLILLIVGINADKIVERQFLNQFKKNLRRMTGKFYSRVNYLASIEQKYNGTDKRIKKLYPCQICKILIVRRKGDLNHRVPCGTLDSKEGIVSYIIRMLVKEEGWEFLCKPCHKNVTNEQRKRGWK